MSLLSPSANSIRELLLQIFERHRYLKEGKVADYIPQLSRADPDWFGIAITTVDGRRYLVGDTSVEFTIQSISKPFIYGLGLDAIGPEAVRKKIDVEPSGEAFNSISLQPETGQPRNPMINAGAIAATGMIAAESAEERFEIIKRKFEAFAGGSIGFDESVYRSESETGFRNRAIANLLRNFSIIDGDVDSILEAYFMQCALLVNCQSLSIMGATLANGGINPVTEDRVLSESTVEKVISVMSTCGMYDYSGNWAFEVGIPAKSGVGGGIVGVLPGQLSVAVFSPLLDDHFNSIRGINTFKDLSTTFGLHLFNRPSLTDYVIRRSYTLAEHHSSRFRSLEAEKILEQEGHRIRVFELQGDLYFGAVERLIHTYFQEVDKSDKVVVDLTRIGSIDEATREVVFHFAKEAFSKGKRIILVDPNHIFSAEERKSLVPMVFVYNDCDEALEDAEENLFVQFGRGTGNDSSVPLAGMDLLRNLPEPVIAQIESLAVESSFQQGEVIIEAGGESDEIFFLKKGVVGVQLQSGDRASSKQVSSFSPGMSFGELGFLQGGLRTATVTASTDVEVFTLDRSAVNKIKADSSDAYSGILEQVIASLSQRLLRANREFAALR